MRYVQMHGVLLPLEQRVTVITGNTPGVTETHKIQ